MEQCSLFKIWGCSNFLNWCWCWVCLSILLGSCSKKIKNAYNCRYCLSQTLTLGLILQKQLFILQWKCFHKTSYSVWISLLSFTKHKISKKGRPCQNYGKSYQAHPHIFVDSIKNANCLWVIGNVLYVLILAP